MKLVATNILVFLIAHALLGQTYSGPIPKPMSGYGSEGTHTVGVASFSNPYYPSEDIKIYYPSDITTPVPTLFYSHAFGGFIPLHVLGVFSFFAKKGYAIVFVPYQTNGVSVKDRYENLLAGFRKAARDYPTIIDTTRVGFMGHSFGGGASFATSYTCFKENNWGTNGRFIHSSAPWYLYNITPSELADFPPDTKLIVEVYDNDSVNDHRIAADAFVNINIPNSEKDFIKVKSDTINGYAYTTGHDLPTTYITFDALDYYAYYRLIDALCDYTFNGNLFGKEVALGSGGTNQITMPNGMQNLEQTDQPTVSYPESIFGFPCSNILNPRKNYCGLVLSSTTTPPNKNMLYYPNPAKSFLNFDLQNPHNVTINIYNTFGQLVINQHGQNTIDVNSLPDGCYYFRIEQEGNTYINQFIKQKGLE
jgi:GR25 family glycosyltransferase involved in LPS biosynthesis